MPVGGLLIPFASSFPLQEDTIAAWVRPTPHSPQCVQEKFLEHRLEGVLGRSWKPKEGRGLQEPRPRYTLPLDLLAAVAESLGILLALLLDPAYYVVPARVIAAAMTPVTARLALGTVKDGVQHRLL